jgi:metal transporter CNNM
VIIPILKEHHRLLTTLLLMNAIAMESLPIFLDRIVPTFWAILISVLAVTIFGEILPQAVCTGPKQILIAAWIAPVT